MLELEGVGTSRLVKAVNDVCIERFNGYVFAASIPPARLQA